MSSVSAPATRPPRPEPTSLRTPDRTEPATAQPKEPGEAPSFAESLAAGEPETSKPEAGARAGNPAEAETTPAADKPAEPATSLLAVALAAEQPPVLAGASQEPTATAVESGPALAGEIILDPAVETETLGEIAGLPAGGEGVPDDGTPVPATMPAGPGSEPAGAPAAAGAAASTLAAPWAGGGRGAVSSETPSAGPAAASSAASAEAAPPAAVEAGASAVPPAKALDPAPVLPDLAALATAVEEPAAPAAPPGGLTAAPALAAPASGMTGTGGAPGVVVSDVRLGAVPIEIGMKSLAGIDRFEIRLDPVDLGRIDVRLDFSGEGGVKAHLVVDRPETLALLQRDGRALDRALEQTGLTPSDDGIGFSLRDPSSQGQPGGDGSPGGSSQDAPNPGAPALPDPGPAAPAARLWRGPAGIDVRI